MNPIRIGTRKSPLAMWQANLVASKLENLGYATEIVPISSEGDLNLQQPIYQIGISGVFTRSLDIALLNKTVDIAVHSLKDVPTLLPDGISLKAFMDRGNHHDILVYKSDDIFEKEKRIIATGSLRRTAFWLNRFPQDQLEDLRGNVQLRIQKLLDSNWDGAIFAYAGLDRSEILAELDEKNLKFKVLDWMISAPSQGIIGVAALDDFKLPEIGNQESFLAATIERQFLNVLEGGCTAPIGAYAQVEGDEVSFKGSVLSLDGKAYLHLEERFSTTEYAEKGKELALKLRAQGAGELIQSIQDKLKI
jgi:hydroxymethylbilane synthase